MEKLREAWNHLRQDGALWVLVALAVGICLLLPRQEQAGELPGEESRIASVLSAMAGAGRVEVAIRWSSEEPNAQRIPQGAVVVAQGAEDIGVRLKLTRAMMALMDLDAEAVEVFAMEQECVE